ncbi:hypothetical protein SAMN05661080_00999 [Modestobacter sp. DSM 44400]|nr:hypothetical protein SAMN05661080_00999 [Modestobacter sp. DSM 44400]
MAVATMPLPNRETTPAPQRRQKSAGSRAAGSTGAAPAGTCVRTYLPLCVGGRHGSGDAMRLGAARSSHYVRVSDRTATRAVIT